MKKMYLIASAVEQDYYFSEAYLFEIEKIKDAPPLFGASTGKKSPYMQNRISLPRCIPLSLIRIKNIIYRASIGDRRKSNAYYSKKTEEELEKVDPFKIPADRKIYFRKKLSRSEYKTFLGKIFVMPENEDGLLFHADTEEKAIACFKAICDTLYFGVLNDNIYLSTCSEKYERDTSKFLMGKSQFIRKDNITKLKEDETWNLKASGDVLYLEFEQGTYDLETDIDSRFWKKLKFIMTTLPKEDYKTMNELYNIVKEFYPTLKGIYLDTGSFYSLETNIMPRPIYAFKLCFQKASNEITKNKLITSDLRDFLLNRNYFIMTNETEGYLPSKSSILKFISNDILVKRIDSELTNFKDFITEKEKK